MDFITDSKRKIKDGFVGQKMFVLPPNRSKVLAQNPVSRNFYLTAIGYYPRAAYHDRQRKQGSQQYILLYCVAGKGEVWIQNKACELTPNTYMILPKLVAHHYRSSGSDPWSIYWVHFSGELSEVLYQRYTRGQAPEAQAIAYDENRIALFDSMFAIIENGFDERETEIGNILLLQFISSLVYSPEINPAAHRSDAIGASMAWMKANLHRVITIDQLAAQQHYSVSYYSELFKKKTGQSPIRYFIQLKIQKSCQYLYFTDKSIKEICLEVGFDDPYYFSRMFKQVMGISPARYRTMHTK